MAVGFIAERPVAGGLGLRGCAGVASALLVAMLTLPAGVGLAADGSAGDQAAQLARLSTTIGDLKTSLMTIRQDLEAMRATPGVGALPAPDVSCGGPPAKPSATGEAVAARVKGSPASPIETAAAAELDAPPRRTSRLAAAQSVEVAGAAASDPPAAAADGTNLQLRTDLALAQLKIAKLTEELRSMRASRTALEAELDSLRSLTDAKIKSFMDWQ
jgi:hypothetical protein